MQEKVVAASATLIKTLAFIVGACVVLGLTVELLAYVGAWDAFVRLVQWTNTIPGIDTLDAWFASTGLNPGWTGYLLAMAILGAFGVFRSRK